MSSQRPAGSRVYLDYNATAPLRPEAREALAAALDRSGGGANPSSPHRFGHDARSVLEEARAEVAALINARPREIVFVSGGTEADNLAVVGSAAAWSGRGVGPGRLVASAIEHPAVLEPCRALGRSGWELTLLPSDREGRVVAEELPHAITPGTALVSVMAANNETGVLQPVEEIAVMIRRGGTPGARRTLFHVDAVQAAGRVAFDVLRVGADLVSISSHKMGGPVGIGALWIREGVSIEPLMMGGGQERRLRPGTEPVWLAAGFAAAARAARLELPNDRVRPLQLRLETLLAVRVGKRRPLIIHGQAASRLPNTTSFALPGLRNETLVIQMDLAGFAVSTGSACSTGAARPSHVLQAMGVESAEAGATIRVSIGHATTSAGIDAFVAALESMVCAEVTQVVG